MGAHMIHAKFQIVSSAGHRCMFVAREIWLCNLFLPCFQANSPTLGQFPALRRVAPGEMVRNRPQTDRGCRSEEHTSELQSLMRISYAVFCLKKKKSHTTYAKPRSYKKAAYK